MKTLANNTNQNTKNLLDHDGGNPTTLNSIRIKADAILQFLLLQHGTRGAANISVKMLKAF